MKETRFKDTEAGRIPADWTIKEIGKVCNTSSGGTPSRSNPSFYEGNIPWITTGELKDGYINDSKEHITESAIANSSAKIVPGNTLLMAMYGATIGKLGIINNPSATNQACCAITPLEDDMKYLFYKLLADRTNLISKGCGAGQPNISQTIIKELKYPFPDIQEQSRIASALTAIDNLISSLDKLIEKKKNIKTATMQLLLSGKNRLCGFTEPWSECRLGDVSQIFRGGSPRPIEEYITTQPDGINWIKIGDVSPKSKYIVSTKEKIKPSGASRSRFVHKGDFILSNSMSFGRPYILAIDGCIHDGWLVIQDYQDTFDLVFLYYMLGSEEVFKQYKEMAAGSSVQNLNKDKVAGVIIKAPKSKKEQSAIASILSSMDNEITALEAKKAKYESIKKGMMQQLLTGKIRLI